MIHRAILMLACGLVAAAGEPAKQTYLADAIYPNEPIYFLAQPDPLLGKYQFSFCFQLFGKRHERPDGESDRPGGLYVSYSQTSFWDLASDSKPFRDSSYRPEAWWHIGGIEKFSAGAERFDLDIGAGHESNGLSGEDSRTCNRVFIRPIATWDLGERWQLSVAPRIFTYVDSLSENPDIAVYRGFVDLVASFGQRDGWQLAALARVGRGGHYGSIQLDLTYPLDRITFGWTNCYAQVQWFSGYAENLIDYRRHSDRVLVGIAIVR